ncbi:MAG: VWA domain-containing protein [Actinocatenispora sp.]
MSITGKHLNPDPNAAPPAQPTDAGWLRLSAALTDQIPAVAGRADLIVMCEPGAGHGAPACLIREQATIEIDGTYLDTTLSTIDVDDPDARDQFPVLWGLLVHEAAHAQHTCWDIAGGTAAAEAATLLEESRIEAAQIRRRPTDRPWLRAASTTILLAEVPNTDNRWTAATAAALVLGRADAGILEPDEVQPVRDAVTGILGQPVLDQLADICHQAHHTDDFDTDTMLDLGARWCTVLGLTLHEMTQSPSTTSQPSDPNTTGTGAGGGSTAGGVLRQAARQVAVAITDHDTNQPHQADGRSPAQQRAAARRAETRAQTRATEAATTVFSTPNGVTRRGRPRRDQPSPRTRPATDTERAAARQLARALRAAAHRDPTEIVATASTPPGRLQARAALTADAQRAAGQQPTAQPWRRTQRLRHPNPPIHVGICVDVSPSVKEFAEPIASAAWISAQATAWAHGTSATITFGHYVTPVVKPGQPPTHVRLFDIENDTAGFPLAVDALDAALDLTNPRAGARLLVVVSDGVFRTNETATGQHQLNRLLTAGCAVLWLAPPHSTPLNGGQHVALTDPARSGQLIARAATTALARA